MAERGCPLEAVPLPAEVRESLAELELELSEGNRPGARPAALSRGPGGRGSRRRAKRPPPCGSASSAAAPAPGTGGAWVFLGVRG